LTKYLFERPLKVFWLQTLAKRKISGCNCLSRRRVLQSPEASLRLIQNAFTLKGTKAGQAKMIFGQILNNRPITAPVLSPSLPLSTSDRHFQ
jgi:hypothetical protein